MIVRVTTTSKSAACSTVPPPQHMHWTTAFVDLLTTPGVELAGSMISCEGAALNGNVSAGWRDNPYVLPHVWAATPMTIKKLQAAGVFQCHTDSLDTRWHSDLGASKVILETGSNLASLLQSQQSVDWRNQSNWSCNDRCVTCISPFRTIKWLSDNIGMTGCSLCLSTLTIMKIAPRLSDTSGYLPTDRACTMV